jgi:hypothetical protein
VRREISSPGIDQVREAVALYVGDDALADAVQDDAGAIGGKAAQQKHDEDHAGQRQDPLSLLLGENLVEDVADQQRLAGRGDRGHDHQHDGKP